MPNLASNNAVNTLVKAIKGRAAEVGQKAAQVTSKAVTKTAVTDIAARSGIWPFQPGNLVGGAVLGGIGNTALAYGRGDSDLSGAAMRGAMYGGLAGVGYGLFKGVRGSMAEGALKGARSQAAAASAVVTKATNTSVQAAAAGPAKGARFRGVLHKDRAAVAAAAVGKRRAQDAMMRQAMAGMELDAASSARVVQSNYAHSMYGAGALPGANRAGAYRRNAPRTGF